MYLLCVNRATKCCRDYSFINDLNGKKSHSKRKKGYERQLRLYCGNDMDFGIVFHIMRQHKPTGTYVEYDLWTIQWNRVNIDCKLALCTLYPFGYGPFRCVCVCVSRLVWFALVIARCIKCAAIISFE